MVCSIRKLQCRRRGGEDELWLCHRAIHTRSDSEYSIGRSCGPLEICFSWSRFSWSVSSLSWTRLRIGATPYFSGNIPLAYQYDNADMKWTRRGLHSPQAVYTEQERVKRFEHIPNVLRFLLWKKHRAYDNQVSSTATPPALGFFSFINCGESCSTLGARTRRGWRSINCRSACESQRSRNHKSIWPMNTLFMWIS